MNHTPKNSACPPEQQTAPGYLLFTSIFVVWTLISWVLLAIRPYLYEQGIIPFLSEFEGKNQALGMHLLFLLLLVTAVKHINMKPIKRKINYQPFSRFEPHRLNLFFLISLILNDAILISKTGMILLSGNYYERMYSSEVRSAAFVMLPYIFISLFFFNLDAQSSCFIKKHWRQYIILLLIGLSLDLLAAGRSLAFFCLTYGMLQLVKHFQNSWSNKKITIVICIIFLSAYFIGQIFNVIRWYGQSFSYEQILLEFNSDSFNEMQSYTIAIQNLGPRYGHYLFGWNCFILDMISRLTPSFIYSTFSLDRLTYWNSTWKVHLQPIFYPNGQQGVEDVGIRIGLVGELDLLLGHISFFVFAYIFAWATTRSRYRLVFAACAVYSIPYGISSIFIPIMVVVAIWVVQAIGFYTARLHQPKFSSPKGCLL